MTLALIPVHRTRGLPRTRRSVARVCCALSLLLAGATQAADSVTLSFKPQPDRMVISTTESLTVQDIDLTGDEALLARNRERGVTFPTQVQTRDQMVIRSRTGPARSGQGFSLDISVLDVQVESRDKQGRNLPAAQSKAALKGLNVSAQVAADGGLKVQRAEGGSVPADQMELMVASITNTFDTFKEAEGKRVEVGQSLPVPFRFEMPMSGGQPLRFAGRMILTLKSIERGVARFTTSTEYKLEQPPSGSQMSGEGSGQGELDFDEARSQVTRMSSDGTLKLSFRINQALMSNQLRMQQVATYRIEPAQP